MGWSYLQKRRLIEIARSTNDLEEAARLIGLPATSTKKLSIQLGIFLKARPPSKPRMKKR
jgi:hypothetical protein